MGICCSSPAPGGTRGLYTSTPCPPPSPPPSLSLLPLLASVCLPWIRCLVCSCFTCAVHLALCVFHIYILCIYTHIYTHTVISIYIHIHIHIHVHIYTRRGAPARLLQYQNALMALVSNGSCFMATGSPRGFAACACILWNSVAISLLAWPSLAVWAALRPRGAHPLFMVVL